MAFAYGWLNVDKGYPKGELPGFIYKYDDPGGYSKIGGASKGAYSRHGSSITMNPLMAFDCEWYFPDWKLAEWEVRRLLIDAGLPQIIHCSSFTAEPSECHAGDPDQIFSVIEEFYQKVKNPIAWKELVERERKMFELKARRHQVYLEYERSHGLFPTEEIRAQLVEKYNLQYVRSTISKHKAIRFGPNPPHGYGGGFRKSYDGDLHQKRFFQWNDHRK